MRRSSFLKLAGISPEAFDVARARKHLPLRGRKMKQGWQDFTVDDALALEAANALARLGLKKADAREVIDTYFDLALDWTAGYAAGETVLLGIVSSARLVDDESYIADKHPLVGSTLDFAEQVKIYEEAIGDQLWVDGVIAVSLNLCLARLLARAEREQIAERRLAELASLFGLDAPTTTSIPVKGLFE